MSATKTTTYPFRLVVRGDNAEGVRVRRVKTIDAPSFEAAWLAFEGERRDMTKGLRDVAYSVLPPTPWRIDGKVSKGWLVEA